MDRQERIRLIKQTLSAVLAGQVAPEEIPDDGPLFGDGVGLDSSLGLQFLIRLEQAFRLEVDEDIMVDELRDVAAVDALVVRLLQMQQAQQSREG